VAKIRGSHTHIGRFGLRVIIMGTYKVRNEIETKRNETKRNQRKRNETKRNEINKNETKRNEINEMKTK
jgi:ribosomal protein S3